MTDSSLGFQAVSPNREDKARRRLRLGSACSSSSTRSAIFPDSCCRAILISRGIASGQSDGVGEGGRAKQLLDLGNNGPELGRWCKCSWIGDYPSGKQLTKNKPGVGAGVPPGLPGFEQRCRPATSRHCATFHGNQRKGGAR